MKAALRGSYLDAAFFMGVNESYPHWFAEELYDATVTDESRYTFWVDQGARRPDYHEKILVEDYSVFLRKKNGDIFVTDYDALDSLYTIFKTNKFNNSALVAFNDDVIDYVECRGGTPLYGMDDDWFYEYFTEVVNHPQEEESIFFTVNNGELTVKQHCAVLQNKFGEIKVLDWRTFVRFYDPNPDVY